MIEKWGSVGAAWVVSDIFTLLQLGWLKAQLPELYNWTMDGVSAISMGIHTCVVEAWGVVKELAVIAVNSS
jgi:hypothetical protein